MLVKELIPYLAFEDGWMPLGSSRYVTNLRRFLEEAAADRGCPVMVIGEVGTKKVSIGGGWVALKPATSIHFRRSPAM